MTTGTMEIRTASEPIEPRKLRQALLVGYTWLWLLVLPITSVVVFPAVKGTTPGYLLSFVALLGGPLLLSRTQLRCFYRTFLLLTAFLVTSICLSQILLAGSRVFSFGDMVMVTKGDPTIVLRSSLITQSLYLLAGFATLSFFYSTYQRWHLRVATWGVLLLAGYGFYEVVYFLAFGSSGDFLSNRVFGDASEGSGSLFQVMHVGGFAIQRLKSLTGEPSMFAFTVLPFAIIALHSRWRWPFAILLASLLLSTSTTFLLGLAVYLGLRFIRKGPLDGLILAVTAACILLTFLYMDTISELVESLVLSKVSAQSVSGIQRSGFFKFAMQFFLDAPLGHQLFGIGFGYIRSTDLFSTLLVNTGIAGFLGFTALFAIPCARMWRKADRQGIVLALVVLYVCMMVSVPEFAYLHIWFLLGIALKQAAANHQAHPAAVIRPCEVSVVGEAAPCAPAARPVSSA